MAGLLKFANKRLVSNVFSRCSISALAQRNYSTMIDDADFKLRYLEGDSEGRYKLHNFWSSDIKNWTFISFLSRLSIINELCVPKILSSSVFLSGVAVFAMNRPEAKNAMSKNIIQQVR